MEGNTNIAALVKGGTLVVMITLRRLDLKLSTAVLLSMLPLVAASGTEVGAVQSVTQGSTLQSTALDGSKVNPTQLSPSLHAALSLARQLNEAFVHVVETVSPSVVVIEVAKKPGDLTELESHPFFDSLPEEWQEELRERRRREGEREERREQEQREPRYSGQGSGVILTRKGHVLTNHHVVDEAEKVRVRLKDGRQIEATLRGTDADSDLAVLQLVNVPDDLVPARFADSNEVRVGEFAIAIGAPFELDYSVTFGHVSAKGREDIAGGMMMDQDFIQTDANINPGNSGGPLVNIEGEVIGINALIRGMRTGIGFAIPSNIAREVSDQLIEIGRFQRSWLGIGISNLRDNPRRRVRETNVLDGIIVTDIRPDGPAEKSELRRDDIIVAVDHKAVGTLQQLRNVITRKRPGTEVILDVYRRGHRRQVLVALEEMPDVSIRLAGGRVPRPNSDPDPVVSSGERVLGLRIDTLNRSLARRFMLARESGVVITEVAPDQPAAIAGLEPGDVVLEFGLQSILTPEDFVQAFEAVQGDSKGPIRYERKGQDLEKMVRWNRIP